MKPATSFFRVWFLTVVAAAASCGSGTPAQVQTVQITSPSGEVEMKVSADDQGRLTYTAHYRDSLVVEESPLGLLATTHDLTRGLTVFSGSGRRVDETYAMPTGKRRQRRVVGTEITVPLLDANGARANLFLRAHDDGVAFRYELLGDGASQVTSEPTGFTIPAGARLLTRPYDGGNAIFGPTAGGYEMAPMILPVGEAIDRTGFAFPALFELGEGRHVMLTEADLDRTYCATRLHETPEGRLYRIRFPDEREGRRVGEVLPEAELPLRTPWRVIAVGDLAGIVESTIVDDLSLPSVVEDTSWIAPGRVAWSWYSQSTGTPALQSEYIDFAEELGWEYVLIDANWDEWENADREVQDLVAEADTAGVKLMLWYNSGGPHSVLPSETPVDRMIGPARREEMDEIASWGIAGIKVDFFNSDKQDRINQYIDILEDAADFELLVNFHGATLPRGWQRTYPHLMTHEAVNGAENYLFPGVGLSPTALINVQHALMRNPVGSMDYTPVVFADALDTVGLPYAHSLALAVLFESGLQHFADRADSNTELGYRAVFEANPFVRDLLSDVPVAWDDTRLAAADIDDHVFLARRSGDVWYLAGIHASDAPAEHTVTFDFLDAGSYELERIEQGDSEDSFTRSVEAVQAGDSLTVLLQPRSGFVAVLRPR